MEPLSSRNKCKIVVCVEMILSGLTIIVLLILFLAGMILHLSQDGSFLDLLGESTQPVEEAIIFIIRIVVLTHLVVLILILVAGQNVISRACFLPSDVTDLDQLDRGISACKMFCRLEVFRMILIVITFMGELSLFNISIVLELLRNVFNVPVIFGWFFVSELQKEFETRRVEVTNSHCLYTLSGTFPEYQHQFQAMPHFADTNMYSVHPEHHPEHLGMFMNTTSGVAYFLSNSNNAFR